MMERFLRQASGMCPARRPLRLPRDNRIAWLGVARLVAAVVLVSSALASAAAAGDVAAGREKAKLCAPCHGMDGLSKAMDAPHIAGQLESYLVRSLEAYRSGERQNEQMSIIAEDLTEEDIADLAAYYAAIEVTVKPPE